MTNDSRIAHALITAAMNVKNLLLFLLCTMYGVTSCTNPRPVYESPVGYDLNTPQKFVLPESLKEISGIAFHRSSHDSLWGVEDELGRIYGFQLGKKKTKPVKFGPQGDYEDLTIYLDKVFVLRSDGVLFAFSLHPNAKKQSQEVKKYADVLPKGEYEGLYINEKNQLYVLCKNCRKEDGYAVKGYMLQIINDHPVHVGSFTIDSSEIFSKVKYKKRFRPSGLTQHKLTGEWYIISSVNKILLIADSTWKVKDIYPLNPAIFRQPEGIAFDTENNLYISNEGDEIRNANILKFDFNKNQ